MAKWQEHLLNKLGLVAGTPEALDALADARKHSRQCQRPKGYEARKKAKRQASKKQARKLRSK